MMMPGFSDIGAAHPRFTGESDWPALIGGRAKRCWKNPQAGEGNRSGFMSDDGRDRFEIPKEMRSMAEATFDQARKAFEGFLAGAQQTAAKIEGQGASVRAGAKDISAKAVSYADKNV